VPELAPLLAGTGILGLFGASAVVLIQLLRQNTKINMVYGRELVEAQNEIKALRQDNWWCAQRVNILIYACQRAGIEVPQEVWDGPPKGA
jgi:hypothetical protein